MKDERYVERTVGLQGDSLRNAMKYNFSPCKYRTWCFYVNQGNLTYHLGQSSEVSDSDANQH